MVKKWISAAVDSPFGGPLLSLLEKFSRTAPNQLQVLTYHKIDNIEGFAQQASYLASQYHVVTIAELLAAIDDEQPLPPNSLLITFDDAYRNFKEVAWPILKRHDLSVTLFVPTAYPGRPDLPFWWDQLEHALEATARRDAISTTIGKLPLETKADRQRALRKITEHMKSIPHKELEKETHDLCQLLEAPPCRGSLLTWSELKELADEGVTLGAHTQLHPLMTRVPLTQALDEAKNSLLDLQKEIGSTPAIFAYPAGAFNDEVAQGIKELGFRLAFTQERGTNDLRNVDHCQLRRNNIGPDASLNVLRTQLLRAARIRRG